MKIALVYPPTCDPTAPYLSVPTLTAYLRHHDVEVVPVDANVLAYDELLRAGPMAALARRLEKRLARLERKPSLSHTDQLAYLAYWEARGDAEVVPAAIEDAVATLRDPVRFYDVAAYDRAVSTITGALRLIGAAHYPLHVDFTAYRTPFSLLTPGEIAYDSLSDRNPFDAPFRSLAERLAAAEVDAIGISVAFPGQLQPAYALAYALRRAMQDVLLLAGGPALTQVFVRLTGDRLTRALAPFDTAVLFEGEEALLEIVRNLERGIRPPPVVRGSQRTNMATLPAPDFAGLPLDRYFSPEPVLPYDPTRGCYWGVCTFCHYGLAEVGTAGYRERPIERVADDLARISAAHGNRVFYFSQDAMSPKTALKLARVVRDSGQPWRWATDMRPERSLTPERCAELAAGGALGMALGVETGSDRVADLIDKGISVATVRTVIANMAQAGLAAEAMCFSDFPTETFREAMATLELVRAHADEISLFFCGRFDLTHGALVAQTPGRFGIQDTWEVAGDELGLALFFAERVVSKTDADRARIDSEIAGLSRRWLSRPYPWAGSLSTAHTLLWYAAYGASVFRELRDQPVTPARSRTARARFDLAEIAADAPAREAEVWRVLVHERRAVSRALYAELVAVHPPAEPRPRRWRYAPGETPEPVGTVVRRPGRRGQGRRPSTAGNGLKRGS